jgi:UDP-N-acetylmuramoyl-L-alanyl-D-glutamate--2,6-diaminopimelate ligase
VPVVTVSAAGDPAADWRAVDVEAGPSGSQFRRSWSGDVQTPVRIRLVGEFNVANALLAIAILHEVGVPPDAAAEGLGSVTVPGRMEPVLQGQGFAAIVDYAHSPDAVERAVAAVRPGLAGRVIVVLGCGGDRDSGKRPVMGEVAARGADVLVVTDDNPARRTRPRSAPRCCGASHRCLPMCAPRCTRWPTAGPPSRSR